METTQQILESCSGKMQRSLDFLEEALLNLRAGKASTNVLHGILVDYYGTPTPIDKVASVNVPDARTILIRPWEKNMINPIEKAIINSNIGLTPSNNGEEIRLTIPLLTEERRKQIVKQVKEEAEKARVGLRNSRRDCVESFKKSQKEGMAEDEAKNGEAEIQKVYDKFSKKVDEVVAVKEKEIMTV
ncbi:MAG: ribosome recycling factor [Alistipes sp.]|jgi:ribosome recycling factor|nr:ribosome recycling factor [Alistipes sp.]